MWNKGKRIISSIAIGFLSLSVISILYLKVTQKEVFTLVSNSMEPVLKEGALLIHEKVDFNSIEVGDIITYKVKNSDIYITHRVKKINSGEGSLLCKGDQNKEVDEPISKEQYHGTVRLVIPYVGTIILWIQQYKIIVMGFLIICALLLFFYDKKRIS